MALSDLFAGVLRWFRGQEQTRESAKNRLQLILVQDRAGVDPGILEALRVDLIDLMSKYFDLSEEGPNVELQRDDASVALVANIPIRSLKRAAEEGLRGNVGTTPPPQAKNKDDDGTDADLEDAEDVENVDEDEDGDDTSEVDESDDELDEEDDSDEDESDDEDDEGTTVEADDDKGNEKPKSSNRRRTSRRRRN